MLNENPVFVVGIFRSGTSLLCSLLNQNPKVALMYECDVWNFPRPLLGRRFKHNWAERIEFYNQALSRHRMVQKHDGQMLGKIHTPVDLYRTFGNLKGADMCGEKSPFYCCRLEQLHKQYPGAAFIFVWRNPVEVYRSVLKAGQTSRFFGKPGMLSRMIYQQNQLVLQSERIEKAGARIYRVDYAGIVDHTETICREISAFLGVPYDRRMLELNKADLSIVYKAPHHAYLRRGIIERQKFTEELVPPAIVKKLERYRHRWEQQQARWLNPPAAASQPEPGLLENARHNFLGWALTNYDSMVRAFFEFMPLPWLRVYRLLKNWVINRPAGNPDEKLSLVKDCQDHWPTILTATSLVGVVALVHVHSNPHLMFILFYGIPCALLALVVNMRWATFFVLACSIISPIVQYDGDSDYRPTLVFMWNFFSRFVLLEIFVLILSRIRMEFSRAENQETEVDEQVSRPPKSSQS
jgi:hypothetical protein